MVQTEKDAGQTREKHPGGRPTDYHPEICEDFEAHFRQGQSVLEVAVELGIARSTIYKWAEEHQEFSDALARAREVSQAWWERTGRENLFDTTEYNEETGRPTARKFILDKMWAKNVSCRFPAEWRDNTGIEISGSVQIIDDIPRGKK